MRQQWFSCRAAGVASVVIEPDPVGDDPHRMLLGLEAVTLHTLFFRGPGNAFGQAILTRTERRDELSASPCPAKIYGPALVWGRRHRDQCVDMWPVANCSLADMPGPELEDPLKGVLVHPQQSRNGSIAKRRLLLDQGLDQISQLRLHLRVSLGRPVRQMQHPEPVAQQAYRDPKPICRQRQRYQEDEHSSSPNRDANCFRARNSDVAWPYACCSSLSWRSCG